MEEDWFLYSITLFTFAVIFTFCYVRYVYTFFERNQITSATYPTFPFGNLYDVFFEKTPFFMLLWKFYSRFKKKKCKFGGFYVFLKPSILIVDTPLIELFLTKNDLFRNVEERSDFDKEFSDEVLGKVCEKIGNVWGDKRFESEEVNFGCFTNEVIKNSIREFFSLKDLDVKEELGFFSVFQKCLSLGNPQKKILKRYKNLIEEVTNQRNNVKKDDIFQILIKKGFSIDDTVVFILTLIKNTSTSFNLTFFALYELCLNKEIQDDLRGEISRFEKDKSSFTYKDLDDLTYLETVICETLRKYPALPFVYKVCKNNYVQNEMKLEKDQLLFVSTFGLHHDAHNYINPESFDPDRFSEENEKFIDPIKYLPFGCQRKNDFDSLYVKLVMKLILIELIPEYEFSLGKKSPKCVKFEETCFELKSKEDMWLQMKKIV